MTMFNNRQEAWDWAEQTVVGDCSMLVYFKESDCIMIFEYQADHSGFMKNRGYW